MSDEEFKARSETYKKEKAKTGEGKTRISKNTIDRTHACLVTWDELLTLDAKEMEITGTNPLYQEKDIDNINKLPDLLKLRQDAAKKKAT